MRSALVLLCFTVCAVYSQRYIAPSVKAQFVETFQSETYRPFHWTPTKNQKYTGLWKVDEVPDTKYNHFPGDKALVISESHRHYAISRKLHEPIDPNAGKVFYVQYEFRSVEVWDCTGAYLKFFDNADFDPLTFSGADRYTFMFGPDRCGKDAKVHFIINRQDPKTGKWVEHHLKDAPEPKLDMWTHHYQLEVDIEKQEFAIYVDLVQTRSGSLATEFEPPLQPLEDMEDPDDRQPATWVTAAKIADPNAKKPDTWDETLPEFIDDETAIKPADWDESQPEYIPDPNSIKPADWDDAEDGPYMHPMIPNPVCSTTGCGKWVRPRIQNPQYMGKWVPPVIDNPAYKGEWKPRRIPNPGYFLCEKPSEALKPIWAIGAEWWTTTANAQIDNIVIGRSKKALDTFATETSLAKYAGEDAAFKRAMSQESDSTPKPLQPWKFMAVGGFIVGVVILIFILKFCFAPAPAPAQKAGETKPKKD